MLMTATTVHPRMFDSGNGSGTMGRGRPVPLTPRWSHSPCLRVDSGAPAMPQQCAAVLSPRSSSMSGRAGLLEQTNTGVDRSYASQTWRPASSDDRTGRPCTGHGRRLVDRDQHSRAGPRVQGAASRRREFCHFADTPSPSLLKPLLKGDGGVRQNDSLAGGYGCVHRSCCPSGRRCSCATTCSARCSISGTTNVMGGTANLPYPRHRHHHPPPTTHHHPPLPHIPPPPDTPTHPPPQTPPLAPQQAL